MHQQLNMFLPLFYQKLFYDLSYFYFIHSFKVNLKDKRNLISFYKQNNQEIPAIVSNNINTIGCQFHPEKSGKAGLQILKNFLLI